MAFALFLYHLRMFKPLEYAAFSCQSVKLAALTLVERKTFILGEQGEMWGHGVLRAWQQQNKMHSFFLEKLTRKVQQAK